MKPANDHFKCFECGQEVPKYYSEYSIQRGENKYMESVHILISSEIENRGEELFKRYNEQP